MVVIVIPGKTKEQQSFYNSRTWRDLSKMYKDLKHNKCERCGDVDDINKITHHKEHITINNVNDAYTLTSLDNLELLCRDCHNKEHFKKDKASYNFDDNGNLINYTPPY